MYPILMALGANEAREIDVAGTFFELRTSPYVVAEVLLLDRSGGTIGVMQQAQETDTMSVRRPFEKVRITNGATPQNIRFYHGEGRSESNRFSGNVAITSSAALDLTAATHDMLRRPLAATASYKSGTTLAGLTAENIFTAAANVNGAILLDAHMQFRENALSRHVMIAKATAPASVTDGEIFLATRQTLETAGPIFGFEARMEVPKFVPAGLGLWFIADIVVNAGVTNLRAARYRLL